MQYLTENDVRDRINDIIFKEYKNNPDALAVEIGVTGSWLRLMLRDTSRRLSPKLEKVAGVERVVMYAEN